MTSSSAPGASAGKSSAPTRRRSRPLRRLYRQARPVLLPGLLLAGLVVVWQVAVRQFAVPVYLLPAPTVVLAEIVRSWDMIADHLWITFATVMAGFALSIVVSLPLAALLTYSSFAAIAVYPLLTLTQSIPKVALAPMLLLILVTSALPKGIVAFLVAFFPLLLATHAGLAATPAELIELGRSLKASRLRELLRIRLPFAVPFVFSGLKVAITLSVIGAAGGEIVAAAPA